MNDEAKPVERVIGLDSHPDSFTAASLRGLTPAAAVVEKVFNKVPMAQLPSWAQKHTTAQDLIVLEASGNSFQVVRTLAALGRQAKVLESCQMGKLKEAGTERNNDKISASLSCPSGSSQDLGLTPEGGQRAHDLEAVARSLQHDQVLGGGVLLGPARQLRHRHLVKDLFLHGGGGRRAPQDRRGEAIRVRIKANHPLDKFASSFILFLTVMQADGNGSGAYMHSGMRGGPHVGALRRCSFTPKRRVTPRGSDEHLPKAHLRVS